MMHQLESIVFTRNLKPVRKIAGKKFRYMPDHTKTEVNEIVHSYGSLAMFLFVCLQSGRDTINECQRERKRIELEKTLDLVRAKM